MVLPPLSPTLHPLVPPHPPSFRSSFSSSLIHPPPLLPRNDPPSCIPPPLPWNEEIYVTNSSIISFYSDEDTSSGMSLISSDQSHYNLSTSTSSSCLSPRRGLSARGCDPIFRTVHHHREGWKGYESQSLSLWIDVVLEEDEEESGDKSGDDDLYESIYEVIRPPGSESDFDEIPEEDEDNKEHLYSNSNVSNLSKIAEAAGRKMKKLRRNWSLKKNDITRSLSRIRKNSRPVLVDGVVREGKLSSVGRRKSSRKLSGLIDPRQEKDDNTMFFITLTIEEQAGAGNGQDSDLESNTYSHTSTDSVLNRLNSGGRPIPPTRRKANSKTAYSVMRPTVAPPAPPIPLSITSSMSSTSSRRQSGSITPPSTLTAFCSDGGYLAMTSGENDDHYKLEQNTLFGSSDIFKSSEMIQRTLFGVEDQVQRTLFNPTGDPGQRTIPFSAGHRNENNIGQTDSLLPCDSLQEFYIGICGPGETIDINAMQLPDIEETYTSSLFQTEPLYQFYDTDLGHMGSSGSSSGDSEDVSENMYECVDALTPPIIRSKHGKTRLRPSRSSAMELITSSTGRRSLWAELPEIIESGILGTINSDSKKMQEAMFEVISSEASYLKSLNILISHFVQSPKFSGQSPYTVITKIEQKILFTDVIRVRTCSEKFLADLESRWQADLVLSGICDIVRSHAKQHFQIYVKYCSNQVYQDRTLRKLKLENPAFVEALKELESSQACQSLAMHSFLMLPMQRITRLPLLIEAIEKRLPRDSPEKQSCTEALDLLNQLVRECNESARSMERMEELLILSQKFDFKDVKVIPLISASRWLVKRGDATRISWKETGDAKLTFGRRVHKHNLVLFLFTDLLLITKKKSDENFVVLDYCPRNMIQVSTMDPLDGVPGLKGISDAGFLLWLTLLQNHETKTQEMLLSFQSESDRLQWMEAVTPATSEVPGEKIYEDWDAPKIEVMDDYNAVHEEELSMQKGETGNILKKLSDGWLFVERSSDGRKGWLPEGVTREIESSHIRAKNFKQRYAFLKLLSADSAAELFMARA